MKSRLFTILILIFTYNLTTFAQIKGKTLDDLAHKYATESFDRLYELLSIPNDAHYPKDIERNIQWCEKEFQQRGFTTNRLVTETVPLLLAERKKEGADKTVLIYLQIDGQPVDKTKWFQESPWKPALKQKKADGEWEEIDWQKIHTNYDPELRVFARSTADSKGAANGFLAALDATKGIAQPNFNIKVIMDFEEELGSPELPKAVDKYSQALAADMLIIFDGPRHISNQPTLTFGARGISEITLTVFGPRTPQHSGHYGNYAPNPAVRLAQLIASMKDADGRVTIPGFYDGIHLDEATKAILAKVPDDEKIIQKSIGIAAPDKVGNNYQEAIQYPSLNVRGMRSGWVGIRSRTIVPATATAEIDVRLVMESDPEWLLGLVRSHIQAQGYYVVDKEPTEAERMKYNRIAFMRAVTSYRAYRTEFDSTVGLWLDKALTRAFGQTPIKIRNSGGSIPIAPFVTTLGIPAVTVPIVNRDNNQHSPNENLRLGNYVDGVKTYIAVLTERL